MSDENQGGVTGAGVVQQVQNARRKKKIEALKGKLSGMFEDLEKAQASVKAIEANIVAALEEAGLDADGIAEALS
jgi:hypothetical protein